MTKAVSKDTRTALLDAAERLMAEHGINGVSLRTILTAAGANAAALHYHFGSREDLIEALLARHGRRNNLRRREMLDALEANKQTPDIYDVVDAVVDPLLEMLREEKEAGRRFVRFLARLHSDRTDIHLEAEKKYFPDIRERLARMLAKSCPHVPKAELRRRVTMMLDVMLQSLANADVMAEAWDGNKHFNALTRYAETLKLFLAGGLSAPAIRTRKE